MRSVLNWGGRRAEGRGREGHRFYFMSASPLAAAFLDSCARRLSCCRAEWNERKQETRGAAQVMSRRFGSSRHDLQASLLVSICRAARDFAERARSPLIEGILEVTSHPRRPNQCDSHVYHTVHYSTYNTRMSMHM